MAAKGRWDVKKLPKELLAGSTFRVWADLLLGCDLAVESPAVFEIVGYASVKWAIHPDSIFAMGEDRNERQTKLVDLEEEFWRKSIQLADTLDYVKGPHSYILPVELPRDIFPTFTYKDASRNEEFAIWYEFVARFPARESPVPDFVQPVTILPPTVDDPAMLGSITTNDVSPASGAQVTVRSRRNHFHSQSPFTLFYTSIAPKAYDVSKIILEFVARLGLPGPLGPNHRVGEERVLASFELPGIPTGHLSTYTLKGAFPVMPPSVCLGPLDISHEIRFVVVYPMDPTTGVQPTEILGATPFFVVPEPQTLVISSGYDDVDPTVPEGTPLPRILVLSQYPPSQLPNQLPQIMAPITFSPGAIHSAMPMPAPPFFPNVPSPALSGVSSANSYPTLPHMNSPLPSFAAPSAGLPGQIPSSPFISSSVWGQQPQDMAPPTPVMSGIYSNLPARTNHTVDSYQTNPNPLLLHQVKRLSVAGGPSSAFSSPVRSHLVEEYNSNEEEELPKLERHDSQKSTNSGGALRPPVPPKPGKLQSPALGPRSRSGSVNEDGIRSPTTPAEQSAAQPAPETPAAPDMDEEEEKQLSPAELLEKLRLDKERMEEERRIEEMQLEVERLKLEQDIRLYEERRQLEEELAKQKEALEKLRRERMDLASTAEAIRRAPKLPAPGSISRSASGTSTISPATSDLVFASSEPPRPEAPPLPNKAALGTSSGPVLFSAPGEGRDSPMESPRQEAPPLPNKAALGTNSGPSLFRAENNRTTTTTPPLGGPNLSRPPPPLHPPPPPFPSPAAMSQMATNNNPTDELPAYSPPSNNGRQPPVMPSNEKAPPAESVARAVTQRGATRQITQLFATPQQPTRTPSTPVIAVGPRTAASKPPPSVKEDKVRKAYVTTLEKYRDRLLNHLSTKWEPMTRKELERTRAEVQQDTADDIVLAPNATAIIDAMILEMQMIEKELYEAYETSAMGSLKSRIRDAFGSLSSAIDAGVITDVENFNAECDLFLQHLKSSDPSAVGSMWEKAVEEFNKTVRVPLTNKIKGARDKGKGRDHESYRDPSVPPSKPPKPIPVPPPSSSSTPPRSSSSGNTTTVVKDRPPKPGLFHRRQ